MLLFYTIIENLIPCCMLILLGHSTITSIKGSKIITSSNLLIWGIFLSSEWFSIILLIIN